MYYVSKVVERRSKKINCIIIASILVDSNFFTLESFSISPNFDRITVILYATTAFKPWFCKSHH